MSLYKHIHLLLHIYLVTLVDLQILQIRLLVKMLRGNSSEKAKPYNIAHIPAKEEEGQIGLFRLSWQGGTGGESFQLEMLSYSFEDDNIQASN